MSTTSGIVPDHRAHASGGEGLSLIIDTSTVAPDERFAMWTEAAQGTFEPMTVRAPVRLPFHGRVWRRELGPLTISRLVADASVVSRTAGLIRAADLQRFELGVQVRGRSIVTQDDRRVVMEPGVVSSWHSSRPYTVDARSPFELLLVYCPDELLRGHVDRLVRNTAQAIPGDRGVGRILLGFVGLLAECFDEDLGGGAQDVADSVLGLVRGLHRDAAGGSRGSRPSSARLRDAVKATVEERLADPTLGPEAIARDHHISRSYLDKLFAVEGTSVGAWIRARRLACIRRDLLDPELAGETVASIGARWAFRSPAHLTRAFRAAYGETPLQARSLTGRSQALTGAAQSADASGAADDHRPFR